VKFWVKIRGAEATGRRINAIADIVNGNATAAYRAAGLAALRIFTNIFKEKGARFGGWKEPGVWTKLLRAKAGRKYSTLAEVAADTSPLPLQDTGIGRASFAESHPNSVFDIRGDSALVGSRLNYLHIHDEGLTSKFQFGAEQEARLEQNFKKGRKGNWNKEFFITRAAMRKADGKRFKQPRRRMSPGRKYITEPERELVFKAFEMELRKLVNGAWRANG
jgi:hypothetical protein